MMLIKKQFSICIELNNYMVAWGCSKVLARELAVDLVLKFKIFGVGWTFFWQPVKIETGLWKDPHKNFSKFPWKPKQIYKLNQQLFSTPPGTTTITNWLAIASNNQVMKKEKSIKMLKRIASEFFSSLGVCDNQLINLLIGGKFYK